MRRIVFLLVFIILIGAGVWYFFLRLTPEKALQAAFVNLSRVQTVQNVQGTLFWVLQEPGDGGVVLDKWLSFAGSLDLRDPSLVQAIGTIGLSETGSEEDFQSADVVLSEERVAFKLQEVDEGLEQWFAESSGTSTEDRWFDFNRNILFEKKLSPNWVSVGDGKDVRRAIQGVELETWAVPGTTNVREMEGRQVMEMKLRMQERAIERGFISLIAAWFLRDPNDTEIDWASRTVKGIVKGDWYVTIDVETKQFRKIQGTWPLLNEEAREIGRVTTEIWMSGFNKSISIQAPEDAVDVTESIDDTRPGTFTPAEERVIPPPVEEIDEQHSVTTTEDESDIEMEIDEELATSTEE